jgi:uncharacterized protein with von Willebrand factor type A (vWA) domain
MRLWIAQIEEDERQRMESPSERKTRERRMDIKDHGRFLKKDPRFRGIVRTIQRLQDGPDTLGRRSVALMEYEASEDEERRESGREFQVTHPHAPLGSRRGSGFPFRGQEMT